MSNCSPHPDFEVQKPLQTDARQFEIECLKLHHVFDSRARDVLVLPVLMQTLIHLVDREQLSKYISVCSGAEIPYTGQEIKCLDFVRNGETVDFKLSKQIIAFFEFLCILHASPFAGQ